MVNKIWEQLLPQELLDQAYDLSELGVLEYAWSLDNIIVLCQILKELDILIVGGDVFRYKDNKVDWARENWSYDGNDVGESIDKTLNYLKLFEQDKEEFLFSLVIRNYRPHLKDNLDWEFNHEGKFVRRYIL